MSTINLNGEWNLSGGDIKCKAQIPGDFHSALFENNIIEDPYKGFNESKIQWIAKTDWTIEREFDFKTVLNSCSFIEIKAADTFFTLYLYIRYVNHLRFNRLFYFLFIYSIC